MSIDYSNSDFRAVVRFFFDRLFQKSDGCWHWAGAKLMPSRGGYGSFTCRPLSIQMARAHRISYQLDRGVNLTSEQHVLHHCDNPICVRPDHLFLGDQPKNMADKVSKSRQGRGETHGMHKLTEDQVCLIFAYLFEGRKSREIAKEMGVTEMTISDIKRGKSWRHLELYKLIKPRRQKPSL